MGQFLLHVTETKFYKIHITTEVTACNSWFTIMKLKLIKLIKLFTGILEPENSSQCSQKPNIKTYPEPDQVFTFCSFEVQFNVILTSMYGSPKWSLFTSL